MATKIEWTDDTWNPVRGCQRISPGCGGPKNQGGCYAERQAVRQSGPGGAYEGLVESTPNGPRWTGAVAVDEEKLLEPLHWRKPRTVFVDSMSDLFFDGFTTEQVARSVATMALTQHITYQVLTKRAERMAHLLNSPAFGSMVTARVAELRPGRQFQEVRWPLENVWWGVSAEDKRYGLPRLKHLQRTPAIIRFVSFEPLLEDLGEEVDLSGIQWAIMGGESGPRSRVCEVDWIRSLIRACRRYGAAPFVKQLGAAASDARNGLAGLQLKVHPDAAALVSRRFKHKKGGDPKEWPADVNFREMPEVRRAA